MLMARKKELRILTELNTVFMDGRSRKWFSEESGEQNKDSDSIHDIETFYSWKDTF